MSESERAITETDRKIMGLLATNELHPLAGDHLDAPELADSGPAVGAVNSHAEGAPKITKAVCDAINAVADDYRYCDIADALGVHVDTISNHVRGVCQHHTYDIGRRRCNVIRAALADGLTQSEVAGLFSFLSDRHLVGHHGTGQCSCPAELPPVQIGRGGGGSER